MSKNDFKIFLSGGMTGLPMEEQIEWRNEFKRRFSDRVLVISPPDFYSPNTNYYKSEHEAKEWDLHHVRTADLIVVNFNVPNSIGTAMELMVANECKIPVIGLNEKGYDLHPWLIDCCDRICDTFDELVHHVKKYFLMMEDEIEGIQL